MSHEASLWAWKSSPKKSSHKFVLVAMAERAGESALCWPSIKRLELDTLMNRKTIITALDSLEAGGFIADTGERRGVTKQVKVYQLLGVHHRENEEPKATTKKEKKPRNGTVNKDSKSSKQPPVNSTESNPVSVPEEQTQKRNSTESGTVPNLPVKSTVFTSKESQKRDTESERNQKRTRSTDSDTDAHEADVLVGDFEVIREAPVSQVTESDQPANNPDVPVGIFGSHLINHCHPYLYWFLRCMEDKAVKNSDALGSFAERLVQFGLTGGYCQKSLANFLNARQHAIDARLLGNPDEPGYELMEELVDGWAHRADEFIQEAQDALSEHLDYLKQQMAA